MAINNTLIIAGVAFVQMLILIAGVAYFVQYRNRRKNLERRILQDTQPLQPVVTRKPKAHPFRDALKADAVRVVKSIGDVFKPKDESEMSGMRRNLSKAGYRSEHAPVVFFGFKSFLGITLLLVSFPLIQFLSPKITTLNTLLFSVSLAMIGFYVLPSLWLSSTTSNRRKEIEAGFPDALDLLVVCVEAGLGLDVAIARVGEEIRMNNKPLSDEFTQLCLELRAGKQHHAALKNLAARVELEDVSSLVTLLIQTDKFGTSLAQALRVQSDFMRVKRYQRAEEMAAKLPVKLLFPLIFFIFPSLFVVIMGPAVVSIVRIMGARG